MSFIHSLEPKAKGVDLGICVIIIDGLHGARFLDEEGFANLDDVRTIFTEAVERCQPTRFTTNKYIVLIS